MIQPTDFLRTLFNTFDQSAINDFRGFLAENPQVTKWQIAADFCLHDKERPNNAFAFTIIPYDANRLGAIQIDSYCFRGPCGHAGTEKITVLSPHRTIKLHGGSHGGPIPFVPPRDAGFGFRFHQSQLV